jgi:hypothetical protein
MHRIIRFTLFAATLFALPLPVLAQTSYGKVAGSVTDSTGAAISNATVTIVSRETGETHVAKTTRSGGYIIESVGTGHYNVAAEAPNFSKILIEDVNVTASTTTSVSPTLSVGKATETIEVSGGTEVLQTESGEISGTITGPELSQLPISSANPYALAITYPGATKVTVGSTGNGSSTAYSVNGSRPRANNYLIEGQDNNDAALTGQGIQPQNGEAFDGVTFLLNGYAPEYGYAGGGVSNIVFKSGTNKFHGTLFDTLQNSSLDATDHSLTLNGATKSKYRENTYGGTIGGPILRDKLFFFAAYQQDHYRSTSFLSVLTLPTAAGYATLNNFSSNPQVAKLLKAYGGLTGAAPGAGYAAYSKTVALGLDPVTGVDRGSVQYGGLQRNVPSNSNSSELDLKGDWLINPSKDKLQLRYIRSYSIQPLYTGTTAQLPGFDNQFSGPAHNAGIVQTHAFTSNLLNEARVSYSRIGYLFDLQPATYANPIALSPGNTISGVQGFGISTNFPQGRAHNTYQLQDSLTWSKGNHTIKVGFDVNQIRVKDNAPFLFYGTIGYVASTAAAASGSLPAVPAYTALGNYIDNYSGYTTSTGQAAQQNFGSPVARPTLTNQNYYVQDHYKATAHLVVDFGLRYEYYGSPFNYIANPGTDFSAPYASFANRVEIKPQYKNFAPRLGFAYQPFSDGKTVVRGALGMFYDHAFTNIADNIQTSAPNAASPILYGNKTVSQRGTPNWSNATTLLSKSPLPLNTQTTLTSNFQSPYTYQYNLAIERQLPGSFGLTIGYAGSVAHHLYSLETLNPVIAATGLRANTARGLITAHANSGDSNYNGLQLELERKYRHGFQARIAYTYAKGLDDVSDDYTTGTQSAYPEIEATLPSGGVGRGRDWGPSAYDHRQRAVMTLVYNSPSFSFSGPKGILGHIISNYSVGTIPSFQSGSVINLQAGLDINNDGISNDRPVLTNASAPINTFSVLSTDFYTAAKGAGAGIYCDGSYVLNALAADAFCHPVTVNQMHFYLGTRNTQNATISRNALYTPGRFDMDMNLQREFKVGERQGITVRAEAFNVLNHANTGIPSFTLYGSTLLPIAAGYGRGTFANYASTGSGGRNLRIFVKYSF